MSDVDEGRFPSAMRVKKREDFRAIYRNGVAWKGLCLSLRVLTRSDAIHRGGLPRLGIVVSKKWGSAVERNRVKRRIREAFRRCASRLPAVDILVRPRDACRDADIDRLASSLVEGVKASTTMEVDR